MIGDHDATHDLEINIPEVSTPTAVDYMFLDFLPFHIEIISKAICGKASMKCTTEGDGVPCFYLHRTNSLKCVTFHFFA